MSITNSLTLQTILQIMKDYTEILVPLNKDILKKVDRESKSLKINAPEGLIEIYLNKNDDEDQD